MEREELCWKIIVLITNLSAVQVGCISMESAVLKVRSVRVSRDHAPATFLRFVVGGMLSYSTFCR